MKRNLRSLNNLDISGSLKVSGSARFDGDMILGDNISDSIFISGTLKNQGGASLTGSFSGSGQNLNNLTASNINNFSSSVADVFLAGDNITINQVGSKYAISSSGGGGGGGLSTVYTDGNITGSGTSGNPVRTKENITGSSFTASVGVSASYYYGDGSNLTGLMTDVYTAGNITGSGTIALPIGITPDPTFTSVTSSYFTGSRANLDYIDFTDQTTDPPQLNGTLWHRTDSDYNELRMWTEVPDVHIKIGQQVVARVHNGTGATIAKGSVVHLTGAISPGVPRIAKADWTNDYLSANTLGVVNSTLNNGDEGYVVISGLIEGIDTSAFAEGDVLYLSGSGGFSNVKAVAPNHLVIVGQVIRQGNSSVGSIFVKIQNGYEIEELHDVLVTSPQNYDLLVRDTDGLWKNTKTLSGSYIFKNNQTISASLYVSGSSYFDVSSSETALRITQRGTGPSIFIEDETSPDSTGFLVGSNGSLGIGVASNYNFGSAKLWVNGSTYVGSIWNYGSYTGLGSVYATNFTASSGGFSGSLFKGTNFTSSDGYSGRLYDTASYALDADKLDGQDSLLFALKTDVSGAITGALTPYGKSTDISSSFITYVEVTNSLPRLSADNTFTGINTLGVFTGSNAFISGDVRINGTASVGLLETVNQTSLQIGDKYIIILSGAVDHASLDGSGLLWGSGAVGDPTQGPLGEMAYVRYYAANDQLEIFPGLKVSGSLTASAVSSFTQISASTGISASYFYGDGSGLTNIPTGILSVQTAGNITGSGTSIDKIGIVPNPIFTTVTASNGVRVSGSGYPNYYSYITPGCAAFTTTEYVPIGQSIGPGLSNTYITGGQISSEFITASTGFSGGSFAGTTLSGSSTLQVGGQSHFNGGVKLPIVTKTSNYGLTASTDYIIAFSGSNLTGTLPNASGIGGSTFVIKNLHTSSLYLTSSTATFDGETSLVIYSRYSSYTLISDGTNWLIV